jgi:hypothetical protein
MTIAADGTVEVDEHHRTRDPLTLAIDSAELERIRGLLESLPEGRLSKRPRFLERASPMRGMRFRLRWDRRSVSGEAPTDPQLAELLGLLDEIRLRAVRSQPR